MIKKIAVIFLFISIILGCSKDDICTGDTPTTPKLIIVFKSRINNNIFREVPNLTVTTIIENDTVNIYKSVTTDSIAIPLNTGVDITEFQFIRDNTNDNPGNTDIVTFSYQRDYIYINRACAFKATFNDLISQLEIVENENWIAEIIVNENTVEDENTTHVIVYH